MGDWQGKLLAGRVFTVVTASEGIKIPQPLNMQQEIGNTYSTLI